MNLYLLRHGIAVDPSSPEFPKDADRPLTPKGRRRLLQIARAMKSMSISFDTILSSPYVRAADTAQIIAKALKRQKRLQLTGDLTPGGDPQALVRSLNELRPQPENVLLVGHEPYLSKFIALLTAGNTAMEIDLKKGGLCKLETESLRCLRCATLGWLLTPRQMALMTGERPAR